MIDSYNAFISYRHADLDSKIAAHVQKSLERFHIPDKIRKTTGKKRIERIFRDKDELPITSDLTETISNALENSDYLIVICSENTKESFWVKREIEYFLRTHSKDHVLTVLAGGEPQDVIPKVLLTRERTFTDENGVEHTIEAPLEPLSCDYRLPMKKADKEELPRLASAIIGCSYDELMNRRRAYRIRRAALLAALIFSLMLAFGMYWFNTSRQIENSLQEAMRRRSQLLANESRRLYQEGDRIEALHLALASVPEGFPDSPMTPQTMRALADSTGAYDTLEGISVDHMWNYYMPGVIEDYCLNEEGDRLAGRDSANNIYVWDTTSHELLMTVPPCDSMIERMTFLDDEKLLVGDYYTNNVYDVNDGEEIWSFELDHYGFSLADPPVIGDSCCAIVANDSTVYVLNNEDGSVENTYGFRTDYGVVRAYANSEGTKLALLGSDIGVDAPLVYSVCIIDLVTGDVSYTEPTANLITKVMWLSDGNFCYSEYTEYHSTYGVSEVELYSENHAIIKKIDVTDLSLIWESPFDYVGHGVDLSMIEVGSGYGICCSSDTLCSIFDLDTGEVSRTFYLDDYIVDISDRDSDGNPLMITQGGKLVFPLSYDSNDIAVYNPLIDNIVEAKVNNGIYIVRDLSDCIMYYDARACNDDIVLTEDMVSIEHNSYDFDLDGGKLVIYNSVFGEGIYLEVVDTVDNSFMGEVELAGYDVDSTYTFAGIRENKVYVTKNSYSSISVIAVDLDTLDQEEIEIAESGFIANNGAELYGDHLCFYMAEGGRSQVILYDIANDRCDIFSTGVDASVEVFPSRAAVYIPEADMIYVTYTGYEALIDCKTEDIIVPDLPDAWGGMKEVAYDSASDSLLITDNNTLISIDKDGDEQHSMSTGGRQIYHMESFKINGEDQILVVYSDSTLVRFDSEFNQIGVTQITNYYNAYGVRVSVDYDEEEGLIYIQSGLITTAIETDTWYEITAVFNSFGYDKVTDGFFVSYYNEDDGKDVVGFIKRYTGEELVERGYEYLNGAELPESHRTRYGI